MSTRTGEWSAKRRTQQMVSVMARRSGFDDAAPRFVTEANAVANDEKTAACPSSSSARGKKLE